MRIIRKFFLFSFATLLIMGSCRKEKLADYYDRPDWLPQPIYQQLKSGQYGNFTLYLSLIDKAGYNKVLDSAGYNTIFAPTDSAFQIFLDENYGGAITNIDTAMAKKIVAYSLVYNAFKKDKIDDYQNTSTGWEPDNAFKRRTVYYKGVYKDLTLYAPYNSRSYNGKLLIDNNRKPALTVTNVAYSIDDNGNKYIPYFTQSFFSKIGLTAFDYNYFYPGTTFTGFNVADAKVLQADIPAENGYIHVVDKVILPLLNIDEYINSNPNQYSRFKEILDSFVYVYTASIQVAKKYELVTHVLDTVFVKRVPYTTSTTQFTPAFAPNNENWNVDKANDSQIDGWVMFAPNNSALNDFLVNKFCKYYGSLQRMPQQIIYDFVNSVMSQKTIWPSQIPTLNNFLGEKMTDIQNNIVDKKILSNGLFYGTDKVHQSDLFYSVYGELYLNPRYSMMTNLIFSGGYKDLLINPYAKYTIFMIPDQVFVSSGFTYDATNSNPWSGPNDAGVFVANSNDIYKKLLRIALLHVVNTDNDELDDLSGTGIVKGIGDESFRFNNNTLYASGNIDSLGVVKRVVNALPVVASPKNGKVYEVDSIMRYTTLGIRNFIGGNPNYSNFYTLLKKSTLFKGLDALLGNSENVILIPDNTVLAANPIFTSTDVAAIDIFIKYHIIPKKSFIGNGSGGGLLSSWLTIGVEPNKINVSDVKNNITITDEMGNTANVINDFSRSYVLSNKTIIHQIDKVLVYLKK